jgi:hypothetical protein
MNIIDEIIEKHLQRDHNNFVVGINSVPLRDEIQDWAFKEYEQGLEAGKIIAKEGFFTDEERMFLEHAIRAWRNQVTDETDKSWLELSSTVMRKIKESVRL